jgi:hypothetical protein
MIKYWQICEITDLATSRPRVKVVEMQAELQATLHFVDHV